MVIGSLRYGGSDTGTVIPAGDFWVGESLE